MAAAVLFSNGLGDHVLAVPALRALAELFPGELTLLTAEAPTEVFLTHLPLARTVRVPMQKAAEGRTFDATAAADLLGPLDWLISLVPWHSSSVNDLLDAVQPAKTIGIHRAFLVEVPFDPTIHAADRAFAIPRSFQPDLRLERYAQPWALPLASTAVAAGIRRDLGSARLLVVHAEASRPEKRWPPSYMEEALRRLTREQPDLVVLVLAHRDPGLDASRAGPATVVAPGLTVATSVAVIAAADVFLGVDSYGLHVADLWQVPAVGLFGPTRPYEFGFRFSTNFRQLDGGGDMSAISVDQVVEAVNAVTAASGFQPPPSRGRVSTGP